MVQKKADSDKSICNTVSSDKNIVAERLVCSLIGLMVPAGGGYIGKGTLTIKEKAERAQQILEQQQRLLSDDLIARAVRFAKVTV